MIKIAIDTMGTDLGFYPIIEALDYFLKYYSDVYFILIGDIKKINKYIINNNFKINKNFYKIINTKEFIKNDESLLSIRRKKNNSMIIGANLLKDNKVDGFISGGPTFAYLAICHFVIGEIDGISRPGFMPFIPTIKKNKSVMMIDVGANLENNSKDLYNFALMAKLYSEIIMKLKNPKIALLNIGTESSKGKELHKETFYLLKKSKEINFIGNIEARDIISGYADIIVTDGFTGNIALKSIEGMSKNLMYLLKKEFTKNFICKLKYLFSKSIFKKIKENFDYRNNAAALMMGINKIAIKTHGNSDKKSWISTFKIIRKAIKNDFVNKIKEIIKK